MHGNCKPIQERLNFKNFLGPEHTPRPPRRAYRGLKNFGHPLIKVALSALPMEPALTQYLVKMSQCNEMTASNRRDQAIYILLTYNSVGHLFTGNKNFQSVTKHCVHQLLCNNAETKGYLFYAI